MLRFLKVYALPTIVCIVLTLAFWFGAAKIQSMRAEAAAKDQLLGAVVSVINYNIQQGKLTVPPEPPKK